MTSAATCSAGAAALVAREVFRCPRHDPQAHGSLPVPPRGGEPCWPDGRYPSGGRWPSPGRVPFRPAGAPPEAGHNQTMIATADAAEFTWSDFPRAELHALAARRRGAAWAGELEAAWLAVQADGWTPLRAAVATCGLIFGAPEAHPRDLTNALRKAQPVRPASPEVRERAASWARREMARRLAQVGQPGQGGAALRANAKTTPRPWGRPGGSACPLVNPCHSMLMFGT